MADKQVQHQSGYAQASVSEKNRFQWEDKSTGNYYRESFGVRSDSNQQYRYHNVTVGNKSDGYSKRYFVEEKFQNQSSSQGGGRSSNHIKY